MTQCKATTKSGRPCRATAVTGKDYCHTHLRLMGEEPPERDGTFASAITGNDEAPVPAPAIPAAPADDGRDPGGVSEPEPAAETAGEPERPADRPSPPIASPPIPPVSRSWSSNASKEEISMDDKKNVSFVSGLALILSALALLLIGISQISSSPYDATMEEIVNQRLEDLESRVDVKLEAGLRKIQRAEENAAVRELRTFQSQLDAWMQSIATEGQTQRIESIRQQIQGLISELEKGMPDAPPAAAMPLPVPPPPATTAAPPATTTTAAPTTTEAPTTTVAPASEATPAPEVTPSVVPPKEEEGDGEDGNDDDDEKAKESVETTQAPAAGGGEAVTKTSSSTTFVTTSVGPDGQTETVTKTVTGESE